MLSKLNEYLEEFKTESLDERIYFDTAKKVSEEIDRRKDVNSNISKLWLALRSLSEEENKRRKEFN